MEGVGEDPCLELLGLNWNDELMPTLFLMCGLPGAGKTTLARMLERKRDALRLTPDEWMESIVGDGYDEARRAAVEAKQWEIASRVLELGANVILDWGFWSLAERDEYRLRAARLGAQAEVWFIDVERDELAARLSARNRDLPPNTFRVTPEQLDEWSKLFEPPTADEPGLVIAE